MRAIEELKEEAQIEVTEEEERRIKSRIKDILYNIANTQKDIANQQKRLSEYQKKLAEFVG